jgi:AcrR family transcriptional regulator
MCALSTLSKDTYHHGDLRAACLNAALELLAEGDETTLSLRAVARRAGVSANAPYRHYPDKDALLGAMATQGFLELRSKLAAADAAAPSGEEFVQMAQAYVAYAIEHPALFRLMFGHPCSQSNPAATQAASQTFDVLAIRVDATIPPEHRLAFMVGAWSLVHGLASLILDGKFSSVQSSDVSGLVESTVSAVLAARRDPPSKYSEE